MSLIPAEMWLPADMLPLGIYSTCVCSYAMIVPSMISCMSISTSSYHSKASRWLREQLCWQLCENPNPERYNSQRQAGATSTVRNHRNVTFQTSICEDADGQ